MTLIDRVQLLQNGQANSDSQLLAEEVYSMLRDKLLGPLESRIDGRVQPRLDAEDALHDAFLRAMADLKSFRGTSEVSFLSWVYRIARNLIADHATRWNTAVHTVTRDSRAELVLAPAKLTFSCFTSSSRDSANSRHGAIRWTSPPRRVTTTPADSRCE